jgi:hypothetical protein
MHFGFVDEDKVGRGSAKVTFNVFSLLDIFLGLLKCLIYAYFYISISFKILLKYYRDIVFACFTYIFAVVPMSVEHAHNVIVVFQDRKIEVVLVGLGLFFVIFTCQ